MGRRNMTGGIVAKRRAEWAARLVRFKASGLPIGQFAAQEGVRAATLSWWRRKLAVGAGVPSTALSFVTLTPVERGTQDKSAVPFEVSISGGRSVRVWASFDSAELVRLIDALEEVRR